MQRLCLAVSAHVSGLHIFVDIVEYQLVSRIHRWWNTYLNGRSRLTRGAVGTDSSNSIYPVSSCLSSLCNCERCTLASVLLSQDSVSVAFINFIWSRLVSWTQLNKGGRAQRCMQSCWPINAAIVILVLICFHYPNSSILCSSLTVTIISTARRPYESRFIQDSLTPATPQSGHIILDEAYQWEWIYVNALSLLYRGGSVDEHRGACRVADQPSSSHKCSGWTVSMATGSNLLSTLPVHEATSFS